MEGGGEGGGGGRGRERERERKREREQCNIITIHEIIVRILHCSISLSQRSAQRSSPGKQVLVDETIAMSVFFDGFFFLSLPCIASAVFQLAQSISHTTCRV